MTRTQPTVVLSKSQDIPFNKLVLSQANVRRVKTGLSIEELASSATALDNLPLPFAVFAKFG
jgi:ParB family chromosome partitioning protein